jgi:AraC family transcriptional regulator
MMTPDVRIVTLPPMRVASTYGFGTGPEDIAWQKMNDFVQQAGLLNDGQTHRYFGFNNPSPAPGSPNYGYEQWITVGPETEAQAEARIKAFDGGLYAVARCRLNVIGEVWQQLVAWRESSPYRHAGHQWLEEALNPPVGNGAQIDPDVIELDLYLPIAQ